MIENIKIENFKSVQSLEMNIGRFNVIIGENGSGKTNILEAIAMASAASQDKLDHEFLASRGIRVTAPNFMRSGFDKTNMTKAISLVISHSHEKNYTYALFRKNTQFSNWINLFPAIENSAIKTIIHSKNEYEIKNAKKLLLDIDKKFVNNLQTLRNKTNEEKTNNQIFTTHNPAILDGLDLNNDDQRLFVARRNKLGHTKINRVQAKATLNGYTMKLSEAFMEGYLGGIPTQLHRCFTKSLETPKFKGEPQK